ncbi:MAG TPA: serine--tRNA ligase [Pseudobdellovibrionaceae bacterium]|nr:serine--tRNA ligase [Pseudobdellovibrionaceae bacterium]
MIDLKQLENKQDPSFYNSYRQGLVHRNFPISSLDELMELAKKRKELITQAESQKAQQNKLSQQVAQLKRQGQDATQMISEMGELSAKVKSMEAEASEMDQIVQDILYTLPNKPHSSVPVGKSEKDNVELKKVGVLPHFSFKPKEHWELGEKLGIIDFERAGKTTGARFSFLKSLGARLERSLMQFMMDTHSEKFGYTEMIPPFIVNSSSLLGTGQLPKFKEDLFQLASTDYFLIPTAEVPVTNYYAQELLGEELLPQKFCAYSPCFRSEAGSYGRDTKGLIRQHQFNKVELMQFTHPEASYEALESLTSHAESILEALELPYRRVLLSTGDMGFGSAKTYDLEVWLPGQNAYREISSCTNFEDFQARRANIRFKPKDGGKPQFVHTLNGSGLAVGRTLVAILENYQQEDGSVLIPKVLQPYMGGKTKITA